jgi:hypothetical protein
VQVSTPLAVAEAQVRLVDIHQELDQETPRRILKQVVKVETVFQTQSADQQ